MCMWTVYQQKLEFSLCGSKRRGRVFQVLKDISTCECSAEPQYSFASWTVLRVSHTIQNMFDDPEHQTTLLIVMYTQFWIKHIKDPWVYERFTLLSHCLDRNIKSASLTFTSEILRSKACKTISICGWWDEKVKGKRNDWQYKHALIGFHFRTHFIWYQRENSVIQGYFPLCSSEDKMWGMQPVQRSLRGVQHFWSRAPLYYGT